MIPNVKPSKVYPNAGSVPPQSLATAAANTGATYLEVPAGSKWVHLRLACGAGAGTVAVTAKQATAADGTGTKAMALSPAIAGVDTTTPLTTYEFDIDLTIDVANAFAFVQFICTTTGTLIVGLDVSFGPNAYED